MSRLLEGDFHVVAKIAASFRGGGIAARAAEQFVEDAAAAAAEGFAENLERIVKATGTRSSPTRIECGVTVLIVCSASLRIAQGLVSLADLFEFFLGGFFAGILVRMIFD